MAKKYQSSLSEQKIFQHSTFVQHEDIKNNITVIPELESLIPPLNPDEAKQLEVNLIRNGCREALLVWTTTQNIVNPLSQSITPVYVLVDGHNRFRICQKNKIDFQIHLVSYKNMQEVREFMIDNQIGRRNLTPEQASYLRGMKYLNLKQNKGQYDRIEHSAQNEHYAETDSENHNAQNEHYDKKKKTAELLGEKFNVGQATIRRDAEFAQGLEMLEPSLKTAVLAGQTKLSKSKIQQLSKKDNIDTKIQSEEEVEGLLVIGEEQREIEKPETEKLIEQLSKLLEKLKSPKNKKEDTCKKIIEVATKLQGMV
jgi:hypothetical protein